MRGARLALTWALLAGAGCAVNSEADCRTVCTWWQGYCTAESLEGCVADCRDSTESAAQANARCVQGQGWGTPSGCESASCCVRWAYSESTYQQKCLR